LESFECIRPEISDYGCYGLLGIFACTPQTLYQTPLIWERWLWNIGWVASFFFTYKTVFITFNASVDSTYFEVQQTDITRVSTDSFLYLRVPNTVGNLAFSWTQYQQPSHRHQQSSGIDGNSLNG
jgi:hypothetical protein